MKFINLFKVNFGKRYFMLQIVHGDRKRNQQPKQPIGSLIPKEGAVVEDDGQRWSVCRDSYDGKEFWVHDNCDSPAIDGKCIMCGLPEPTVVPTSIGGSDEELRGCL